MFRQSQLAICRVLLGLFACVAMMGEGLHWIPGTDHVTSHASSAQVGSCGHGCHHGIAGGRIQSAAKSLSVGRFHNRKDDRSLGCCQASRGASGDVPSAPQSDDCPICKFLAQAQSPYVDTVQVPHSGACEFLSDAHVKLVAISSFSLHPGRAPPAI